MRTQKSASTLHVKSKPQVPAQTIAPPPAKRQPLPDGKARISAVERELIAKAAYFRAERRGFAPGNELRDWLEAEAEIERLLGR